MQLNQENVTLFNNMILEAIIYGRGCEENLLGCYDDTDLCKSVKLFLYSLDVENIVYKQEGYINLANGGNLTHTES